MRMKTTNRTIIEVIVGRYARAHVVFIIYYWTALIIAQICSEIRVKLAQGLLTPYDIIAKQRHDAYLNNQYRVLP